MIKGVQYQYEYDAEDRLITVNDINENKIASYTYDAEGNRSTKTTYSNNNPVNITTYHYCNGEILYETVNTDPANVIHALYIRTPDGALEAVSLNYVIDSSSNTFYYYHYNAHGDVIAVTKTDSSDPTNITGKIYRQYAYDPYGNIISAKDGSGNAIDINNDSGFDDSYLYAGYRYDKESGLYFLNARYYAPGLGRFLSKDSEIDINNAKSLNAYVYCQDDPVNLADPDGDTPVMTDDAGHYVYSNGKTYTNKAEVKRAQKQSKAVKKKTTKTSTTSKKKKETTLSKATSILATGTNYMKSAISTIATLGDLTKVQGMQVSGYCYAFSTPFAIWSHWADPNLTTGQKWGLTAMEIGIAAIGIAIGGITAPWAIAAVAGYAIGTTLLDNYVTNICDEHGKK